MCCAIGASVARNPVANAIASTSYDVPSCAVSVLPSTLARPTLGWISGTVAGQWRGRRAAGLAPRFRGCRAGVVLRLFGGLGGERRRGQAGDPVALPRVRIRKLAGCRALRGGQHRAGPAGPDHLREALVRLDTPVPVIAAVDRLEVPAQPHLDLQLRRAGHERGGALVAVIVAVFCHRSSCSLAHWGPHCPAGPPMSLIRLGRIPGSGLSGSTVIPASRSMPDSAAQISWVTRSTTWARLIERRLSHHSPVLCTSPVMPYAHASAPPESRP